MMVNECNLIMDTDWYVKKLPKMHPVCCVSVMPAPTHAIETFTKDILLWILIALMCFHFKSVQPINKHAHKSRY